MRGVILAGGNGTRLRPLTDIVNKHLIAVYDRPMIDYPIQTLIDLGITDILIISGREHAGQFISYLGSGADRGRCFSYKVQDEAGGIAQALALAEDFAAGSPIAVILGDNFFSGIDTDLIDQMREDDALVILKEVSDPQRFGVAEIVDGRVAKIIEKPEIDMGNLAVTGLYFYPADVFEKIRHLTPSDRGELEISDINGMYIGENRLSHATMGGFWSDMGTPFSLARTIQHILEN